MFFLFIRTLFIRYKMVGISKILTNVLVFRLIQDSSLTQEHVRLDSRSFLECEEALEIPR